MDKYIVLTGTSVTTKKGMYHAGAVFTADIIKFKEGKDLDDYIKLGIESKWFEKVSDEIVIEKPIAKILELSKKEKKKVEVEVIEKEEVLTEKELSDEELEKLTEPVSEGKNIFSRNK